MKTLLFFGTKTFLAFLGTTAGVSTSMARFRRVYGLTKSNERRRDQSSTGLSRELKRQRIQSPSYPAPYHYLTLIQNSLTGSLETDYYPFNPLFTSSF